MLRKIVAQWPELDRAVAFFPGNGYRSILTPNQARELAHTLGGKFKIIVHRDRDSLTDEEVLALSAKYHAEGVDLWMPAESDVEAYFCVTNFLEVFLGCSKADADGYLAAVFARFADPIRQQFDSQRASCNEEFYRAGGSPRSDDVWAAFQARPLKGGKGKYIFGQLKNIVPGRAFSTEAILASSLGGQVALDLKHKIDQVIAGAVPVVAGQAQQGAVV